MSARSHDAASHQEMRPRVSVWDRLERPKSIVLDIEYPPLPKFRIQAHENNVLQQHGLAFLAAYSEQHRQTFEREVPAVGYRHRVFQSHKARKPMIGTVTSTEPHTAYNLSRKRRYGMINPNSGEFSSGLQYKQAKQDVEKPSLVSQHSPKPDIFSVCYMIVILYWCHSCKPRFLTSQSMMSFLLSGNTERERKAATTRTPN